MPEQIRGGVAPDAVVHSLFLPLLPYFFFMFSAYVLKSLGRVEMGNQSTEDKTIEEFTWTIENFSKLNSKTYSETFFLSGYPWRIVIYPEGNKQNNSDHLSIYLDAGDLANLPKGWSRYASFELALANQVDASRTIVKESKNEFDASHPSWGFQDVIQLDELFDPSNGFIMNDACIIKAGISVKKSEHESPVDQAVNKIDISPVSAPFNHTDTPIPLLKETSTASYGDLVDFKGLGKIVKDFVPLLEEVCSWHPSLIGSQMKRNHTRMFTEWAFTALGRVLHFLKTKKVKDMNDDACNHLQTLWKELETFGFDLSWLEPHLKAALGKKSYVQRAAQVKRLREHVVALEKDLKIARKNLVEAEEGFVESDLDAELGYGAP